MAAEKRLHTKLLSPIRDIYRHMADLLVTSGYLRPLELLHWEGKYLGFFLAPGEGDIIGIKKVPLPLLLLGREPVCFMLMTKAAAGRNLLEKERTGLAFQCGKMAGQK